MHTTYDPNADALYIQLLERPVSKTKRITDACILDLDEQGNVIGVEVLYVRETGIDPINTNEQTPEIMLNDLRPCWSQRLPTMR